eukprot:CAMPEP_0119089554 /NCGR_PEP_ID=MMETSP1178-20130426/149426_1 /TAXON_ID=33656 /ORGANISM="unid sp, Strain CCMP2000" /LENGTH=81 /DNA_ID=CAMNT_0007072913 /DNA_START=71 /DNA_END=313 /DNA_ORIENTATION=+
MVGEADHPPRVPPTKLEHHLLTVRPSALHAVRRKQRAVARVRGRGRRLSELGAVHGGREIGRSNASQLDEATRIQGELRAE